MKHDNWPNRGSTGEDDSYFMEFSEFRWPQWGFFIFVFALFGVMIFK